MQKTILYFLISLSLFSCGVYKSNPKNKSEEINQSTDTNEVNTSSEPYELSIAKWDKAKKEHNNSYTYTVNFSSFTGYRTTTIITVSEGEVVKRIFYEIDPTHIPEPKKADKPKFIEDKTNLNSHNEGSPAVAIDQLYVDCSEKYLTADKNENIVTFEVDNYGILNICGYTPKNCIDDCFVGVSIGKIEWNE